MNQAYITIEDTTGNSLFPSIAEQILEEFDNLELELTETTEYYFVIKVFFEEYDEIQDLIATTSYLLAGANICRFITTINYI